MSSVKKSALTLLRKIVRYTTPEILKTLCAPKETGGTDSAQEIDGEGEGDGQKEVDGEGKVYEKEEGDHDGEREGDGERDGDGEREVDGAECSAQIVETIAAVLEVS